MGCNSGIFTEVPIEVAGAGEGSIVTRVCLDGTCRAARGQIRPRINKFGGTRGTRFSQSGIEVSLFDDVFLIDMTLPTEPYDDIARHDIRVEFQIAGREQVTLEREMAFARSEPNGAFCGLTCWVAELSPSPTPGSEV